MKEQIIQAELEKAWILIEGSEVQYRFVDSSERCIDQRLCVLLLSLFESWWTHWVSSRLQVHRLVKPVYLQTHTHDTHTCLHLYIVPLVSVDAAGRPALTVARLPRPLQGPWIHKCFIALVQKQVWHTRNLWLLFQPKDFWIFEVMFFCKGLVMVSLVLCWFPEYFKHKNLLILFLISVSLYLQWESTVFGSMTRATVNASHSWWSSK